MVRLLRYNGTDVVTIEHHGTCEFMLSVFLLQAAILQQTAQHMYKLQKEKDQLVSTNMQLKRMLSKFNNMDSDSCSGQDSPPPKRKKHDTGKHMCCKCTYLHMTPLRTSTTFSASCVVHVLGFGICKIPFMIDH